MAIAIGADGTPYQSRNGMSATNTTCKHCTGACSCRIEYMARNRATGEAWTNADFIRWQQLGGDSNSSPRRGQQPSYVVPGIKVFSWINDYRIVRIRIRKVRKPKPSERLMAWVRRYSGRSVHICLSSDDTWVADARVAACRNDWAQVGMGETPEMALLALVKAMGTTVDS